MHHSKSEADASKSGQLYSESEIQQLRYEIENDTRKKLEEEYKQRLEREVRMFIANYENERNVSQKNSSIVESQLREYLEREIQEDAKKELARKEKELQVSYRKKIENHKKELENLFEAELVARLQQEKQELEAEKNEIGIVKLTRLILTVNLSSKVKIAGKFASQEIRKTKKTIRAATQRPAAR